MPQVLIVEDEPKLAFLLKDYFTQAEFDTHVIHSGSEVMEWLANNQPCAILLDVMLPGVDGITLCQEIRLISDVPILMTTAKSEEADRLLGLEIGADDYICKPYSPKEIVARVKVILRRVTQAAAVELNRLTVDANLMTVKVQQQQITLTAIEFAIVELLNNEPGRVFSREQVMNAIYSDHRVVSDRTIDSHIKKLRKKIKSCCDDDLIQSVYGVGYKLTLN